MTVVNPGRSAAAARASDSPTSVSTSVPTSVPTSPPDLPASGRGARTDAQWIAGLRDAGPAGQEALAGLHGLLLRAARHQVWRLHELLPGAGRTELEDLAQQAADDASIAVLRRLGDFEGRSRFTTWAYKFGILHGSVAVRRQAWRLREVALGDELDPGPAQVDRGDSPSATAEANDLARALRGAIADQLTPHQRRVTIALLVDRVPIDVLAQRLGTNRNALYKTLHDARRRLRSALTESGHLDPTGSTP